MSQTTYILVHRRYGEFRTHFPGVGYQWSKGSDDPEMPPYEFEDRADVARFIDHLVVVHGYNRRHLSIKTVTKEQAE
jgi:hypothetical protein